MINCLTNLKTLLLLAGIFLLGFGCTEDPLIYTHPEWLGGSNIETLEKEGDCTVFLALMEKAEYTVPIEKQLFALFVPRDSAFREYFKTIGINSVDELSDDEAFKLFTMYVLPNPLSRYQIIYEYAWDLESPEGEYGALFFRKKTRSILPSYTETPEYHPVYAGEELTIETDVPLYIPFFTTEYMEDYFASADGSDYEFLCRGSKWSGTQWHDAMVTDAEVRTSNGFIYYLDRVVIQHPTADAYLKDHPEKYSVFYDMIQPFAGYVRWVNKMNEVVYRKTYNKNKIYDIANPEGPSAGGGPHIKRDMFTLFMPSNEAWMEYFSRNKIDNYEDLTEITRIYLIQSHIIKKLGLKSKIDKGMGNTFGDMLDIDTEKDITGSYLCSNAAVYDLNRVLEPFIFSTVAGPLFLNNDYSTFLLALYLADKMNLVSSRDFDVTLFPINNAQFEDIGVRYNEADNEMQFLTKQEKWVEYSFEELSTFIEGFIVKDKLTDFSGEGFFELVSGEYVYYNNNKLSAAGNIEDNDYVGINEAIENEVNGMLIYIDTPLKASHYTTAERIKNDPELSEFYNLLLAAGMISINEDPKTFDLVTSIAFLKGYNDWTIFAPTNDAVIEARENGDIPLDIGELRNFIYNHVIRENVIFDDGKKSGVFNTRFIREITPEGITYSQIDIQNSLHNMMITDASGQVITVVHDQANKLVQAGVMHKVSRVLLLP
jgi:uncharacterized surface protein with fasciclin (FAS1) repeats